MMTIDIAKVIELADADVGQTEATGENDGPYVESILGGPRERGNAWCIAAVMRWYQRAGFAIADMPEDPGGGKGGPAPALPSFWLCRRVERFYHEAFDRGAIVGAGETIEPGDVLVQIGRAVANASASGHAELVVSVNRPARGVPTVQCIGGNVRDAVRRTSHALFSPTITAYVRPSVMWALAHAATPPGSSSAPTPAPRRAEKRGKR